VNKLNQWMREDILIPFIVIGIILIASILRIDLYGDPRLSISGNDTESYVTSSRVPLFSSEIMTGRRLLSTNLVYKVLEPETGYEITINGSLQTTRRGLQPGFEGIVILQLILSITGWGYFAFVLTEYLRNPITKILGTLLIVLFAFTPQIADWDSILMSESLTFSLYMLQFAIISKIAFLFHKDPNTKLSAWIAAWMIIFFVWVFLRDTNLFAALVTLGMIGFLLIFVRNRKNSYIYSSLLFLGAIFILGFITSSQSIRSLVQITNVYNDDLLPSPLRTSILQGWGMPDPRSAEYDQWFEEHASKTLIKFMITHPGYPLLKILNDFPMSFTEIKQTYFKAPELNPARAQLMHIGDTLHPENTTPFLASLLLLIAIILSATRANDHRRVWAWLGCLLFITASVTLIPTILGDTWAINRHALFSTMIYRLCMWIFIIILADFAIETNKHGQELSQPQF
jgi:hypothetical protein